MAQKTRKLEEVLSLQAEVKGVVSYADYFAQRSVFYALRIVNDGKESVQDLTLTLSNENGLLLPCEKQIGEIPFESKVEIDLGCVLSPHYFVSATEVKEESIFIELKKEKKVILSQTVVVQALPFDYFEGTKGDNELLASFVRPRLADCVKIKSEVSTQLKKWGIEGEFCGYESSDKNTVRHTAAALFACLRRYSFAQKQADISSPVEAGAGIKLLSEKSASEIELALFFAGCLESMDLHPILVVGERHIACGVWLYENCFIDCVSDDTERLKQYLSDGINNLSCFDIADLFSDKSVAYSTSEKHFIQKLDLGDYYDKYVDVKRARIGKIYPLPLKAKTVKGYEILSEEEASPDAMPKNLAERKNLSLSGKQTKDKQWERRLLDLSMKNALLNFLPEKGGLQVLSVSPDQTLATFIEKGECRLAPVSAAASGITAKKVRFNVQKELGVLKELVNMEIAGGVFRTLSSEPDFQERALRLYRKSKEAEEESGTKILYLAFGFLKWFTKDEKTPKFAPLVLQPVALKKAKGGEGFDVVSEGEEFSVNSTLLEFLKQEFNVDIRGLDGAVSGLKISEILAMIRAETVHMKGWEVYEDCYFSAFSFARYQMWQDLRKNMDEFSKNPLISSLLNNHNALGDTDDAQKKEDEVMPVKTLTPLPADSSQWEAISLSQTGKTFVLHGPPGTGKSQTITNMIANALNDGKRVLFVAEKQAALSVVKKRLDGIGLGDFCLELHSGKANKSDVLQKLSSTLSLAATSESVYLKEKSDEIGDLKKELSAPMTALHKKRRLGVSVYEAMLVCLKNKNAPDVMNIESSFYDGLTKEKIETYKTMMIQSATAAKECGGVCNSPFSNVNLTEYSTAKRDAVYCASEVVIAEIKHLKNYVTLFLELYRQRISSFSRKKLQTLGEVVKLLSDGSLSPYFTADEEEFHAFFGANKALDNCFENYFKRYKKLVDAEKEYKELGKFLDEGAVDYTKNKASYSVYKKLSKLTVGTLKEEQLTKDLETVYSIYESMEKIRKSKLSKPFTGAFKKVDFFETRKAYMEPLYRLNELCASLFMDYNADSFFSMCLRAQSGYTAPVLEGLKGALKSFSKAETSFLKITNADKSKAPEEDVLEAYTLKAGTLIDNIDMLANWCAYKQTAKTLGEAGLTFITDALESGSVSGENIVASFEKNIYKNFLQTNIPLDPVLARFSATLFEEETESLRLKTDEFARLSAQKIRAYLISRIPTPSTEGGLSLELVNYNRLSKSNLRGMGLRKFFEEIPELIKVLCPCMLMSPNTVSQYLKAESGLFDIVIFDEASQMPTAEAVGSLARAKSAVVVGDPKQLPPTTFFNAGYVDEENLENEDMESVLDDCLALGIPQKRLSWHYRSKHESLIAFSNATYYGNKLCTFPSPDALSGKVRLVRVEDGVYDKGFTKKNKAEGDALVEEVVRRLTDPVLKKSSIGVVTFSSAQKEYIERKLSTVIAEKRLEEVAYEREEPLFVKNLENVQGDERDVILFSVCYGPDKHGRISLNFGPLNQAGGWRRLNVAVSRAREEMVVFSSMTGAMIDLSKTGSKGVAGLKAFLEFAEKGKTTLAMPSQSEPVKRTGIGKYIAAELSSYGYDCRYDVGVSDFKIDVAVVDPKNRRNFILAVLCDGEGDFSVKDRNVLQIQTLKRNNWNVTRVFAVNYYNNPKREIKRIKDLLDKLTGADKKSGSCLQKAKKNYKVADLYARFENATFVLSGENDGEIVSRLKAVVSAEEPISYEFLVRRVLSSLGILKYGGKIDSRMQALIALCGFKYEKLLGRVYYRKSDKCVGTDKYRVETGEPMRKSETDFTPYEVIALVKGALEDKVALYPDEIMVIVNNLFRISRPSEKFAAFINDCITLGEEKGLFVRSVSDRIALA